MGHGHTVLCLFVQGTVKMRWHCVHRTWVLSGGSPTISPWPAKQLELWQLGGSA